MDFKKPRTPKSSLNKSHSQSSSKKKRPSTPKPAREKESFTNIAVANSFADPKHKRKSGLVKKKLDDIKQPDLIIKVSYKKRKVSIPLSNLGEEGIYEVLRTHITRFEHEILKNTDFDYGCIQSWRTVGPADVLKDYYFQTGKSLGVFKGSILEIEPIWKKHKQEAVTLSDFQIIRCIGTGGFSRVFLARFLPTGNFYALKLMEKEGLFESGKECVVTNEREIMTDLDHPQILRLEFAFETKHFVALALEYCPGGELFYYLRKVRRMTEDEARYCFVEILLGIQYLHSKKIIYRDIKPENIMIDKDGNLKIADFGLSRKGIRPSELAYTFCGSPEYMAPEMLAKAGHSFSVDYYCLGALLYELVTGSPPFYSRDVEKIYYSIQNEEIDFPPHVELSNEIKMLLEGLLAKDPKRRLGSLGGIREILGHPWVRKIKPADITNQTIETPIQVNLLTFNINEEQIDNEVEDTYAEKLKQESGEFEELFDDFYFNRSGTINILEDVLPSVKSDSTKENKSLNMRSSKQKVKPKSHSKEATSFPIQFKNVDNPQNNLVSEGRGKKPKKLPRTNSKKKMDWVVSGRERPNKSINKKEKKERDRMLSPMKSMVSIKASLKRIKSSTALQEKMQAKARR